MRCRPMRAHENLMLFGSDGSDGRHCPAECKEMWHTVQCLRLARSEGRGRIGGQQNGPRSCLMRLAAVKGRVGGTGEWP